MILPALGSSPPIRRLGAFWPKAGASRSGFRPRPTLTGTMFCVVGRLPALESTMPRDDLPFAAGMAESADATDEMQGARSNALIIISPAAPYEAAKQFTLAWHSALDGALRLLRHREVFYCWTGTYYAEVSRERVDAEIYEFLSRSFMVGSKGELIPVRPNIGLVANVLKALKGWTFTNDDKSAPAWLGCIPDAEPSDILACANGLLHLPTRALMPHTPEFFCLNALPFGYDADAPPPIAWLKFLSSLWPDDQQSIDALQHYFGLCLSSETRYQKALAIIGPPRSGKGTIARTLTAVVGKPNTCSLTFAQIAERFGLTGLVRARLAILADARLGHRADKAQVIERL